MVGSILTPCKAKTGIFFHIVTSETGSGPNQYTCSDIDRVWKSGRALSEGVCCRKIDFASVDAMAPILMAQTPQPQNPSQNSILVVHVGAGRHAQASLPRLKRAIHAALSANDFRKSSQIIEECPLTNTGYGSSLTADGAVECDASFVEYSTQGRQQGSLVGITNQRYPITCTLDVYLYLEAVRGPDWKRRGITPPTSLIYPLVRLLLSKQPLSDNLILPRSRAIFDHYSDAYRDNVGDTVGIIYNMGSSTQIAASSGGNFFKISGRVGCSGIVGAGLDHVRDTGVEISCLCSGNGEDIINTQLAAFVSASMIQSMREGTDIDHPRSLETFIRNRAIQASPLASQGLIYVGVIMLLNFEDGSSYLTYCHSTESFMFGYSDRSQRKRVVVSHLENPTEAGTQFACGEFKLA